MKTVKWEIFDDLLIGNFMKTTSHNMESLYENDFNFYVTKYGDNGGAQSIEQLEKYFKEYHKRIGMERFYEMFSSHNIAALAKRFLFQNDINSIFYQLSKKLYRHIKPKPY